MSNQEINDQETNNWMVVTCAPTIFGKKESERPYIRHHDIKNLHFHLVTTYKIMEPPTCLCGLTIPEDIIRQFNFRAGQYKIELLPLPEKTGFTI